MLALDKSCSEILVAVDFFFLKKILTIGAGMLEGPLKLYSQAVLSKPEYSFLPPPMPQTAGRT